MSELSPVRPVVWECDVVIERNKNAFFMKNLKSNVWCRNGRKNMKGVMVMLELHQTLDEIAKADEVKWRSTLPGKNDDVMKEAFEFTLKVEKEITFRRRWRK